MAASIQLGPALTVGAPQPLFHSEIFDCDGYCYDVFGDSATFLLNRVTKRGLSTLRVVRYWLAPGR